MLFLEIKISKYFIYCDHRIVTNVTNIIFMSSVMCKFIFIPVAINIIRLKSIMIWLSTVDPP